MPSSHGSKRMSTAAAYSASLRGKTMSHCSPPATSSEGVLGADGAVVGALRPARALVEAVGAVSKRVFSCSMSNHGSLAFTLSILTALHGTRVLVGMGSRGRAIV